MWNFNCFILFYLSVLLMWRYSLTLASWKPAQSVLSTGTGNIVRDHFSVTCFPLVSIPIFLNLNHCLCQTGSLVWCLFCVEMSAMSDVKEKRVEYLVPRNCHTGGVQQQIKRSVLNTCSSSFNHAHAGAPDSTQPVCFLPLVHLLVNYYVRIFQYL